MNTPECSSSPGQESVIGTVWFSATAILSERPKWNFGEWVLHTALTDADISLVCNEANLGSLGIERLSTNGPGGIVFTSTQSVVQSANGRMHTFMNLIARNRVMLLDGEIDLQIGAAAKGSFDVIEFDWAVVAS